MSTDCQKVRKDTPEPSVEVKEKRTNRIASHQGTYMQVVAGEEIPSCSTTSPSSSFFLSRSNPVPPPSPCFFIFTKNVSYLARSIRSLSIDLELDAGLCITHMFYARDENDGEGGKPPLPSGRFLSTSFTLVLSLIFFVEMFHRW